VKLRKQHAEDGSIIALRNVGILPHYYMASLYPKDGSSMVNRNGGVLPQHYTASIFIA